MAALAELGLNVKIWPMPVEIPDPIRFEQDHTHASYDAEAVHRFWIILTWVDEVFKDFRAQFHRQSQSRALLVGKLRSCRDALLRKARS